MHSNDCSHDVFRFFVLIIFFILDFVKASLHSPICMPFVFAKTYFLQSFACQGWILLLVVDVVTKYQNCLIFSCVCCCVVKKWAQAEHRLIFFMFLLLWVKKWAYAEHIQAMNKIKKNLFCQNICESEGNYKIKSNLSKSKLGMQIGVSRLAFRAQFKNVRTTILPIPFKFANIFVSMFHFIIFHLACSASRERPNCHSLQSYVYTYIYFNNLSRHFVCMCLTQDRFVKHISLHFISLYHFSLSCIFSFIYLLLLISIQFFLFSFF